MTKAYTIHNYSFQRTKHPHTQAWLITLADLILLMTCFFVMRFAMNMEDEITAVSDRPQANHTNAITQREVITAPRGIMLLPASQLLIYNSLKNNLKDDNIKIIPSVERGTIKIVIAVHDNNFADLRNIMHKISRSLFHFVKNHISITMSLNIQELNPHFNTRINASNKLILQKISNLLDYIINLRNVVAINLSNHSIVNLTTDLSTENQFTSGDLANISIYISAEPN